MKKFIALSLTLLTTLFCACMPFDLLFGFGDDASSTRSVQSSASAQPSSEPDSISESQTAPSSEPYSFLSESPESLNWELVDWWEFLNDTTEYDDGSGLFYFSTGNSVSFTNRDNNRRNFSGTCSWSEPPSVISSDGLIQLTLTAEIDEFDANRVGTFSATVKAFLDSADLASYKYKTGAAIDLKTSSGDTVCEAYGKDGSVVVGSMTIDVSTTFPTGKKGDSIALIISTNLGGGKKYIYRYGG